MPGAESDGDDSDGFMPRDEIVRYFEQYVERFHLPVRYTRVNSIELNANGDGYRVMTSAGEIDARNVVIATGLFQKPKIPAFSEKIARDILQLPVTQCRNPRALPGAVLVVGSAQSGCQISGHTRTRFTRGEHLLDYRGNRIRF